MPVTLIISYDKSAPKTDLTALDNSTASPTLEETINDLVAKLAGNGPDAQAAQQQLIALGNQALPVLQRIRPRLAQPVRRKVMAVIAHIRNNGSNAPEVFDGASP